MKLLIAVVVIFGLYTLALTADVLMGKLFKNNMEKLFKNKKEEK